MTNISDEEQIQKIKDWWKKNGTAVLLGIAAFLIVSFGWRYWQNQKVQMQDQASITYEQMLAADQNHKADDFNLLSEHLRNNIPHSPYASIATLIQARNLVDNGDFTGAQSKLQWVINNSSSTGLRQIARLRESRVLFAAKQLPQALQILTKVDDETFLPVVHTQRGDLLLALGKPKDALQEYRLATQNVDQNSPLAKILELKIGKIS